MFTDKSHYQISLYMDRSEVTARSEEGLYIFFLICIAIILVNKTRKTLKDVTPFPIKDNHNYSFFTLFCCDIVQKRGYITNKVQS